MEAFLKAPNAEDITRRKRCPGGNTESPLGRGAPGTRSPLVCDQTRAHTEDTDEQELVPSGRRTTDRENFEAIVQIAVY
jgi:hypothetical protein